MLEHDNHEQNPFTGISPRLAEHLRNEVYKELTELGEMQHVMHKFTCRHSDLSCEGFKFAKHAPK